LVYSNWLIKMPPANYLSLELDTYTESVFSALIIIQ
jgi:hypothetical protein